jgi:hypothetical protein
MQFQFSYCRDGSTVFWYGDYRNINFRWQLSRRQMRVLVELRLGDVLKRELRRKLIGNRPTASQRASLSRALRRLKERNLMRIEGRSLSLTRRGIQVHDDLQSAGCRTLSSRPRRKPSRGAGQRRR